MGSRPLEEVEEQFNFRGKKMKVCVFALLTGLLLTGTVSAVDSEVVRVDPFLKSPALWSVKSYWPGKQEWANGELILRTEKAGDDFLCRAAGIQLKKKVDLAGRRFRITATVYGNGMFRTGFLVALPGDGSRLNVQYAFPEEFSALTEKAQKISYIVELDSLSPVYLTPTVELRGESAEARLKSVRVERVQAPGADMTLLTPLAVVPDNTPAPPRRFRSSAPGAEADVFVFVSADSPAVHFRQPCDEKGELAIRRPDPVNDIVKITAALEGAAANGFAVSIPPAEYEQMSELAKQVPAVDGVKHILYIGDSLNDFDRGYNSVDRLEYFLNLHQPGHFVIHNYSVAGDYITRVEERLRDTESGRYAGIFGRKYDLILIALGNNDCRSLSTTNYTKPLVDLSEARASYERVIALLRKHSDSPIWLFSSSYSNYEQQIQRSEEAVKAGRTGIRFGKQEHLDNYNGMLKSLADGDPDLRYIDICTPMKAAFSPDNYADGVHLSLQGHRLFSGLLLRAFTGK